MQLHGEFFHQFSPAIGGLGFSTPPPFIRVSYWGRGKGYCMTPALARELFDAIKALWNGEWNPVQVGGNVLGLCNSSRAKAKEGCWTTTSFAPRVHVIMDPWFGWLENPRMMIIKRSQCHMFQFFDPPIIKCGQWTFGGQDRFAIMCVVGESWWSFMESNGIREKRHVLRDKWPSWKLKYAILEGDSLKIYKTFEEFVKFQGAGSWTGPQWNPVFLATCTTYLNDQNISYIAKYFRNF